jgi:hypothetical protein
MKGTYRCERLLRSDFTPSTLARIWLPNLKTRVNPDGLSMCSSTSSTSCPDSPSITVEAPLLSEALRRSRTCQNHKIEDIKLPRSYQNNPPSLQKPVLLPYVHIQKNCQQSRLWKTHHWHQFTYLFIEKLEHCDKERRPRSWRCLSVNQIKQLFYSSVV